MQLQLVVHFPCGRVGDDGAWAADWEIVKVRGVADVMTEMDPKVIDINGVHALC